MAIGQSINDIHPTTMNSQVPLIPDLAWDATTDDYGDTTSPDTTSGLVPNNFMWIQGFFNATSLLTAPDIVVTSGHVFPPDSPYAGQQICSIITFAYSGERQLFRGTGIVSSGRDRKGNEVASIGLDSGAPTTSFSRLKFLGGMGASQ